MALKEQNPDLKVMIAIGGWAEGGKKYSDMANTAASRTKFVQSAVAFVKEHGFDGLDYDWEYPGESAAVFGGVRSGRFSGMRSVSCGEIGSE